MQGARRGREVRVQDILLAGGGTSGYNGVSKAITEAAHRQERERERREQEYRGQLMDQIVERKCECVTSASCVLDVRTERFVCRSLTYSCVLLNRIAYRRQKAKFL